MHGEGLIPLKVLISSDRFYTTYNSTEGNNIVHVSIDSYNNFNRWVSTIFFFLRALKYGCPTLMKWKIYTSITVYFLLALMSKVI